MEERPGGEQKNTTKNVAAEMRKRVPALLLLGILLGMSLSLSHKLIIDVYFTLKYLIVLRASEILGLIAQAVVLILLYKLLKGGLSVL